MFDATLPYAGLLALLFLVLTVRVIQRRRSVSVSLGDGDDRGLMRRIRAQGNCAETAPLGLLLMALLEGGGMTAPVIHALGVTLVVGRVLHGAALSRDAQWPFGRMVGMALTLLMLTAAAVFCLAVPLF